MMKLEKLIILSIVLNFFFMITSSAIAANNQVTIDDEQGDVYILPADADLENLDNLQNLQKTNEKPNIDIKQVSYSKPEGSTKVTITLDVYGQIENVGDLMDFLSTKIVYYQISLETMNGNTENLYTIVYMNQTCSLTTDVEEQNITDFTVNGGRLTVPFNVANSAETYKAIYTTALEMDFTSTDQYMDIAPNVFPLIVVPGEDAYEGSVGQNIEFTVTASGGTQPYSYQWNFEDGSTSTEQNPTHVYTATGEYDATITVTDNSETSESGTVIVTIIDAVILPPSEPTNSNIWLFVGIIAIIVIVGTAIVIYILRR